ncbi:hypothetical protein GQ43DRAFT_456100 [Delitschia confertaspora ATCC 74209]|uniref:Uncharacterized protein n=1 Tax=Delitschia confertaspora ATCC 74209 TaxID=1513339 RepID=A0A9P4MRY7_9PLEO|nr:hypothetical protein GQ43DRAFT_456100 [Delitschia confertaspora ATCC 74209]
MSLFRSAILRSSFARPVLSAPRTRVQVAAQRFASGDYGSGEGSPVGEKPKEQGRSKATEEVEHPGPAPPKAAQKGNASHDRESSSSSKHEAQSTEASKSTPSKSDGKSTEKSGGEKGYGSKGPQPKILNENPPAENEEPEEVRKHNKEMDGRAEKAHESVSNKDAKKDKVGSKFWAGQGGADRDP